MTGAAFQMGALACECGLERSANPFGPNWEQWEAGFAKAMAQWRARQRADIADRYGDEAADDSDIDRAQRERSRTVFEGY